MRFKRLLAAHHVGHIPSRRVPVLNSGSHVLRLLVAPYTFAAETGGPHWKHYKNDLWNFGPTDMAMENGMPFFKQGIHLHLVGCPLL